MANDEEGFRSRGSTADRAPCVVGSHGTYLVLYGRIMCSWRALSSVRSVRACANLPWPGVVALHILTLHQRVPGLVGWEVEVDVCTYDGKTYASGAQFADADGCNHCGCGPDGNVACTEMGCVE
jgi:hypothetical protein